MTKTWYFTGTARWAKLKDPDPKYHKYSIDLYMDEEQFLKFKESEAQLKIRNNPDETEEMFQGDYVTFNRPSVRLIKGSTVEQIGPPDLLNAHGEPMDHEILVGNGSKVTLKVDVFDTAKGKGTRLVAVRVDELVEFKKKEVDTDIEEPF